MLTSSTRHLSGLGARTRMDYNRERTKANLFATFGDGPGGIVLSGHSDVVPVDGQAWDSDLFCAQVRDDRLVGRGACDMKGFIGVVLAHAAQFASAPLKSPIHIVIQDLSWREEAQGLRMDVAGVPFSTLSTNVIIGGNGNNIIPAECEFFFDYRYVPGVAPDGFIDSIRGYVAEHVEPRMQARFPDAHAEIERTGDIPALDAGEQDSITRLARSLLRPHPSAEVAYDTEGGFFQNAGIPAVVCGPGSIEQAHKANEYVLLSQLHECEMFMQSLVKRLSLAAPT